MCIVGSASQADAYAALIHTPIANPVKISSGTADRSAPCFDVLRVET